MARIGNFKIAGFPLMGLLASCSVIDTPISTASGSGIDRGSAIALVNEPAPQSDISRRTRDNIEKELIRTGYRLAPDAEYILEFAIARRPADVGILLPGGGAARPEAGTWRSRPLDRNAFALCNASIYRLMVVISRRRMREIVLKSGSDEDICGEITDEKLRTLVASSVARLHVRSIR